MDNLQSRSDRNTIANVTELCSGCGTCVALCPKDAISIQLQPKKGVYYPFINKERCISCGLCLDVCPGYEINFIKLNMSFFMKEPSDSYIGNVINCYAGFATDNDIRYSAASGGIVSSLLGFALEKKIVDGAIVTGTNNNDPLRPLPFIAYTGEGIISASTSKYCPVPVNIAIKEILSREGSYAVVGLPCHIAGLRKAEQVNKKLKDRVKLHFCLVCNHTPSFCATDYLLSKLNTKGRIVQEIRYRGKGWPGGMTVIYKDGTEDFVNHLDIKYWGFVFQKFFWPRRCFLCDDKIGELSDISFMDPYLPEFNDERIGASLFVTRSNFADQLVKQAGKSGVIDYRSIDVRKIKISQGLSEVRQRNAARRKLFLLFRRSVPVYRRDENIEVSFGSLFRAVIDICLIWLGNISYEFVDIFSGISKIGSKFMGIFRIPKGELK